MEDANDFSESDKGLIREILGHEDDGGKWPSLENIKKEERGIKRYKKV